MNINKEFKKFFIEFAQENFAQVTSDNALTIYTAGAKMVLEWIEDRAGGAHTMPPSEFIHNLRKDIDTELDKLK